MLKIKEFYHRSKERMNPEGLVISGTLAGASILAVPPVQAGLTFLTYELGRDVSLDNIKLFAIAFFGLVNAASVILETETLKKHQYSVSPVTSVINTTTGRPMISSVAGHAINFTEVYGVNPVNLVSIVALLEGDQGRLFIENAIGVTATLGLWKIGLNSLILNNHIEPVVKKFKNIKNKFSQRFQKKNPI